MLIKNKMLITPIDKKRVKELEELTTPYSMVFYKYFMKDEEHLAMHEFHDWFNGDDDLMYSSLYKKVDYISKKLGMKQTYYVNYECRTAVWGFVWGDAECLMCYSERGLSLQVMHQMRPDKVITMIKEIIECWRT